VTTGTGADTAPSRPSLLPWLRAHQQSWLVVLQVVVLLVAAAAAGAHLTDAGPVRTAVTLPWWLIAVAFAATEACVFHVQTKREARTVSVSELPLVLGLVFAAPAALLVGRLVGSAAVFVFHRRSAPLKTTWNLALISLQTVVAVLLFRLVASGQPDVPWLWVGAYLGPIVANCLGSVALTLVIAVYERGVDLRDLGRDLLRGEPAAPVVVTLALVAVTSLQASPANAWLLVPTLAGLLAGYRAYAALTDRHLNLERLFRFTQAVSSSPEVDQVLGSVLAEAKELLHAERADIAFLASAQGDVATVQLGATDRLTRVESAQSPEDAWLLAQVVEDGATLLMPRGTRDPQVRAWLDAHAAREALAVPLRGGAGVLGALVVTDRLGDVRTYDQDDVLLLETVANHASVALQNGELVDQLRHEELHDALTGLPNRAFLQRRLSAALTEVADGVTAGAAVMILDLDGFKEVNDTLGHAQGDQLLIEVGARLTAAVGSGGLVARLGGDEFAVLVAGTADEDHVVRVARRAVRALEHPVVLDGMEVEVGGSMGIALAPLHATEPAALLKQADLAMYDAKASGRGLRVYEAELDSSDPRRLTLVAELRSALAAGGIAVHVQPQARATTGETVSVEALVRWEHAELGWISPVEFIPIAERSGLIGPLTTHVLDRALAAVADWQRQGLELGIAVNLSTRSLLDADLVDTVQRLLRRHGVPAAQLTLEVTEGSVMADPARAIGLLHQLRDLGCRLSVDDFGTGYSSLSYLKRLPVHEVKIDRSFITGLRETGEDLAIVRAIVDLGRHMGLQVVAEGVEDQRTWDLVASTGCDLIQGWHISRAMPTEDLAAWLRGPGRPDQRPVLHAL
jgi:diguanylate cyclase (GGDEF)-like protein